MPQERTTQSQNIPAKKSHGWKPWKPPKKGRLRSLWEQTSFSGKSGWDWLQLLIVPLVLTGFGLVFTAMQDFRQQTIEEQRAQDAMLQAYLGQMSDLMVGESQLRNSVEGSEVRTLARARTLTVLRRLDESRKAAVMQFLGEAELIQGEGSINPIIYLSGANLNETDLVYADLNGAHLNGADLINADLSGTDLRYVTGITDEELERQANTLEGATMPNGQKYEEWLEDREASR